MGDETLHSYFATKRDHEWMKIELYRFLNEKDNVEISFLIESLSEHYCGDDAIYVEGIEFRALKKVEHEYIDKVKEVHQVFKSNLITEDVQQILQTVNEKVRISFLSVKEQHYSSFNSNISLNIVQLFSLSEVNGKKHLMLSATTIFSSSSDSKFYESKPLAESRFHEVIELLPQVVFYIKCAVENHMLSSDTKYTCFLVFKLSKESQGMNGPVKVRDLLHRENKDPEIIYFTNPNPWNLNDVTRVPEEREDGWMEVRVSKFDLNRELDQDDCLLVNLKFKSYEGTMSGLSVSGLEFRPA
ncbi:F-box protein At2g02240-like [Rutidosis leptorrhynchoides]|uniref:F-box protein At2g02240-like n=1 Tax=Rutidosis leptorrhynchoides TaxID=125765 RepID=UPI003A99A26A